MIVSWIGPKQSNVSNLIICNNLSLSPQCLILAAMQSLPLTQTARSKIPLPSSPCLVCLSVSWTMEEDLVLICP